MFCAIFAKEFSLQQDSTNGLSIAVNDLGRAPGSMREIAEQIPAPKDFGVSLLAVPEGSELDLNVRLEAVHEGILVTGTVSAPVVGQCSRCLEPLAYQHEAHVQELYYYPDQVVAADSEEGDVSVVEDQQIDLEPVLRDVFLGSLPFQPVCSPDCQGLCPQCGVILAENPGHQHENLDPRWSALADLGSGFLERITSVTQERDSCGYCSKAENVPL